MRWGKEQGYRSFSLGMAPLSGFERSPVAPLWNRLGSFIYAHGETLYNFQGLRAYKDKFRPSWESRYLAYPGGLTLPRTLADVAALIAGGYRRILLKGRDSRRPAPSRDPQHLVPPEFGDVEHHQTNP
jgi:phosphatidylglycerol lysyltransferase